MSEIDVSEYVYEYEQDKPLDLPEGNYVKAEDVPAIVAAELERLAGEFNAISSATTEPGAYWSGIADAHNIDTGKLLARATQLRGALVERSN